MTAIRIEGLVKKFGETPAVSDVHVEIASGSLFCLLGLLGVIGLSGLPCLLTAVSAIVVDFELKRIT